jgi:hypothetical protein
MTLARTAFSNANDTETGLTINVQCTAQLCVTLHLYHLDEFC